MVSRTWLSSVSGPCWSGTAKLIRCEPDTPSCGTRWTVTLVPSKGVDLVVMPDLTGQTLAQAGATLAGAGLNVGSLLGSTQGLFAAATVAGDPADPGETFKRGTAVDLVFL